MRSLLKNHSFDCLKLRPKTRMWKAFRQFHFQLFETSSICSLDLKTTTTMASESIFIWTTGCHNWPLTTDRAELYARCLMLPDRQLTSNIFASNDITMILCLMISTIEFVGKDLERLEHSIGLSCWYGCSFSSKSTFPSVRKRTNCPAQSNQAELDGPHDVERWRQVSSRWVLPQHISLHVWGIPLLSQTIQQESNAPLAQWREKARTQNVCLASWE